MNDVYIGKGKLAGKGVYAARDFDVGEIVEFYNLKLLSQEDFDRLPKTEQMFVHSFWGRMYLFPEPSRYTNHSSNPNTESDLKQMCDIAVKPIKKGEMVTTSATKEIQKELETVVKAREGVKASTCKWLKGGYRNAKIRYSLPNGKEHKLDLKRIDGNWRVVN